MRILWMSNSPMAGTGYGVQTAEVVPRIKAAGHEIAVACNHGVNGTAIEWPVPGWDFTIPLLPPAFDQACNDVIRSHAGAIKADWTISLYDTWTMRRNRWPDNTASWVPIDHQPVPPAVAEWCKQVTPIAMSRFGQTMLREQGIDSTYIPHSVNTKVFKPTEKTRGGITAREWAGIPDDAYVVLIAAANSGNHPPRKAWGQMYQALSVFMRRHPDVWVHLHTDRLGGNRGIDLELLEKAAAIPSERVRWTNPYAYVSGQVAQTDLAAIYSGADVLLASSMGEGFGVPVIEAQACGLPVIVSDFTAQPELCESGWLVNGQLWWDEASGQGQSWFFDPYVPSIVKRLEEAYAARGDQSIRDRAVSFAQQYDSDLVFDRYWVPFLDELEAKLEVGGKAYMGEGSTAQMPMNREERRNQPCARCGKPRKSGSHAKGKTLGGHQHFFEEQAA